MEKCKKIARENKRDRRGRGEKEYRENREGETKRT